MKQTNKPTNLGVDEHALVGAGEADGLEVGPEVVAVGKGAPPEEEDDDVGHAHPLQLRLEVRAPPHVQSALFDQRLQLLNFVSVLNR